MATLGALAALHPTCGRVKGLADDARQVGSMRSRLRSAAVGTLSVFAFGAVSGVEASAQQDPQSQAREAPPVATAPSPSAAVGDCNLAAIVGGAPCKAAALSNEGARGPGCG